MKRTLIVAALAAIVSACGGGDNGGPTGPSNQPFNQTVNGTVSNFGIVQHPVAIPRSGTMRLTLTWQASADLDLYLTGQTCSGYPPSDCQILVGSDRNSGTQEQVVRDVAAGDTFKAWVDNFSTTSVNYTLQISVQ